MCGILSIDGTPYRFMGLSSLNNIYVPVGKTLKQTSLTVLPTTTVENDMINSYTDLKTKFSTSKGDANVFCTVIASGYVEEGMGSAEEAANTVNTAWGGVQYLALKQQAYDRLVAYYNTLNG